MSIDTSLVCNAVGGTSDISITKPAGTVEGDFLLFSVGLGTSYGSYGFDVTPSGLTLLGYYTDGGNYRNWVYYKIAGPSEPASYAWSTMYSSYIGGAVWRLTGVDTITPLDNATVRGNGSASGVTSLLFTSLNSTTPGALLVLMGMIQTGTVGSTSLTQKKYIAYHVTGYTVMASPGASGNQTMNTGGAGTAMDGQMFILKPAAGGGIQHYTLAMDPGSFGLSGAAVNLRHSARILNLEPSTYSMVGSPMFIWKVHPPIVLEAGTFALTGAALSIKRPVSYMRMDPGAFAMNGTPMDPHYGWYKGLSTLNYQFPKQRRQF